MDEKEIKVTGMLTLEDIQKIVYEVGSKGYLTGALFLFALLIGKSDLLLLPQGLWIAGGILISMIAAAFALLKYSANKTYRDNKMIQTETQFVFSHTGMTIDCEHTHTEVSWDKVFKVRVGRSALGIYISGAIAYWIPKKWFADPAEVDRLVALLREQLPKAKMQKNALSSGSRFLLMAALYMLIIVLTMVVLTWYQG